MPEDYITMVPLSVYRAAGQIPFQYLVSNGGPAGPDSRIVQVASVARDLSMPEQRNFYFENMYVPARVNKYR
jgi:hypothetical protein